MPKPAMSESEKGISKIKRQAISSMKAVGTYRTEYNPTVEAYAALRWQYENLLKSFFEKGCNYTETFINKNGAASERKAIEYQIMEGMRKDLLTYENTLGLTPLGVKRIRKQAVEDGGDNALMEFLKNAEI